MSPTLQPRAPEPSAPTPPRDRLPAPRDRSTWLAGDALPWALAAASAAVALAVALVVRGRTHPDEVYQYLEPAHRLVYGFGERTWEWRSGLRNWAAPGAIAGILRGLRALHEDGDPRATAAVLFALGALGHGLGMLALFRIIERRSGRAAAALGVALLGTWLAYVIYAPRMLADALTLPPLLGALWHTLRARDGGRLRAGLVAGGLLGLAVVLRYPSLVFAAPLGACLLGARRWRAAAGFALGGLAVAAALGVLDALTWGGFLHSFLAYVAFNRPGGPAGQAFGAKPWWWLALPLGGMIPLVAVPGFVRGLRKPDVVVGCWFFYLACVALSPHKEGRFLLPLLPLGMAIAAGPVCATLGRWRAARPKIAAPLALGWLGLSVLSPTLRWRVALDRDLLDAQVDVGRDPSLRGVALVGVPWFSGGGAFYLNRDVPATFAPAPGDLAAALEDPRVSHAVVMPAQHADARLTAAGFREVGRRGEVREWRRRAPSRDMVRGHGSRRH